MPLYPFSCRDCGHEFDALVPKATDTPTAECPACDGRNVVRGFGLPAKTPTVGPSVAGSCGVGPPCGAAGCLRVPR